jgi:hypothetical protein
VHDVVAEVGELLCQAQFRLAAAQLFLAELAGADVADDADEAGRVDTVHPPHGQVARETAAVLAARADFAADTDDPLLTGLGEMLHVAVVRGLVRLGHQQADVAAGDLRSPVAEQALRRETELLDRTLVIDDDDGVDGRVEQRAELAFRSGGARDPRALGGGPLGPVAVRHDAGEVAGTRIVRELASAD